MSAMRRSRAKVGRLAANSVASAMHASGPRCTARWMCCIEVYVDPTNPAESVIERRSQSGMIFLTLAGFIVALGILLLMVSAAIWWVA